MPKYYLEIEEQNDDTKVEDSVRQMIRIEVQEKDDAKLEYEKLLPFINFKHKKFLHTHNHDISKSCVKDELI